MKHQVKRLKEFAQEQQTRYLESGAVYVFPTDGSVDPGAGALHVDREDPESGGASLQSPLTRDFGYQLAGTVGPRAGFDRRRRLPPEPRQGREACAPGRSHGQRGAVPCTAYSAPAGVYGENRDTEKRNLEVQGDVAYPSTAGRGRIRETREWNF